MRILRLLRYLWLLWLLQSGPLVLAQAPAGQVRPGGAARLTRSRQRQPLTIRAQQRAVWGPGL
jgi:hypothetical protein